MLGFSREKERGCVCVHVCMYVWGERERERGFKELAYSIVESGKATICRVDQQAGDPGMS